VSSPATPSKPVLKLAALGDSISTGFNASSSGDNLVLSWATGTSPEVASHRLRLAAALPHLEVEAKNAAVAGARATQLPAQAQQLVAFAPDYATILVGANDLSEWFTSAEYGTRLDRFGVDVSRAVETLTSANPRVMILLAGVPNQARVVDVLIKRGGLAAAAPWLGDLEASVLPSLRRAYAERHQRMEQALAAVAAQHKANVRFAAGVGRAQFGHEDLSEVDRYHPSGKGQKRLAELAWGEGWF
jgi:lysophospholipase L1-like esterase